MMPAPAEWGVFIAATTVLLIVPGPSVIFVLTQTVEHGRKGALYASLGLALGDFVQAALTAVGISAVLASSVMAFQAVRYAGSAYLVFLGLRRFGRNYSPSEPRVGTASRAAGPLSLIVQAFLALNPKTAVFFLALFPQIIDVFARDAWAQMLLFGGAFALFGFCTNFLFGSVGASLVLRIASRERLGASTRYATGAALIALGLAAAIAR